VWGFELAQVAVGPGDLIAVTFIISLLARVGAQDRGNALSHTGFLSNTYFHVIPFWSGLRRKDKHFFAFAPNFSVKEWLSPVLKPQLN
jgi:hypothetical protein